MAHSPSGECRRRAEQLPITLPIQRRHPLAWLLCRGDVAAVTLRIDGRLGLEYRDGRCAEAEVDSDTTVFPRLVVLRYRVADRAASLILPQAATGAEAHRRLRVWLRWRGAAVSKQHEST